MDKFIYSPELFLRQIEKLAERHGIKFPGGFEKKIGMRGGVSAWQPLNKKGLPKKYSIPSVDTLLKIKSLFNVSVDWLLTGEEPKSKEISQPVVTITGRHPEIPPGVHSENFLLIPQVSGRIVANYARGIPPFDIKGWVCLYLTPQIRSRQYHDLLAVQVGRNDRSMEPAIKGGDTVIIDPQDKILVSKGIYAFRKYGGEECNIRRVYKGNNTVALGPDNLDYTPFILTPEEAENVFIGRVLWSWTNWVSK